MEKYLYADLSLYEKTHWWHRAKTNTVFLLLQSCVKKYKNPYILDIGCGTGNNVAMWGKLGKAYGVDSSTDAVSFCKQRGLKNIFKGKGEKTPFRDHMFACVTMLDVLEHIENESKVLQEIKRVLGKNGMLILTVPAFPILWSRWDEILHHKRRYTRKSLIAVLTKNNFEIEYISYQYSFLFIPALIIRTVKSFLNKNKQYPSDFSHSNVFINWLMMNLSLLESKIKKITPTPFGTTLLCVARNK